MALPTTVRRAALALVLAPACHAHGQVVLNEISASNLATVTDNYGAFEDWVELYNPAGAVVDISGWHLSDSQNNPLKWAFPPGSLVPANGRIMVFCSGRNVSAPPTTFHTNFKLSQGSNERVVLSDAQGNVLDNFHLTDRTKENHSRGRTTDGAATWSLFLAPTPNAPNAGASPDYAAKPVFSIPAGTYPGAQSVAITSPGGDPVRYTLDGSTPTPASALYTAPLNITAPTVVRAACFSTAPGTPPSFIESNTYLIGVSHTVAILSLAGDQVEDLLQGNGGLEPVSSLEYFGPNGVLRDEATGTCNKHGQDSWAYGQRGFDWVTRDQFGYNDAIHYPVFRISDRDKYQRLIVKAAAGDNYNFGPGQPAHIRDPYVESLSQMGDLKLNERSYEPCVLYLNGQYWGVYDLREKVDDHDFTNYYYDQGEYDVQFIKTWGGTWAEYGGAQAMNDWNALRTFITTNNMGNPAAFAHVDSLYSWKSLIDYFCLNSYVVCADWLNWNTGWWRGLNPNGGHKKWGYILWDEDATFGHYTNFTGIPDQSANADPCTVEDLPDPGGQGHTEILDKLIQENPMVHDYYVNRYIDLGNTLFSCNYMIPYLDSLVANIAPEMPGQVARWGGSVADWQANVQVMRDFIQARCVTIQDGLIDCYGLSGPYQVTFDVDPPLSGTIRVNSQVLPEYPFTGTYYGGITTTLAPIPEQGWAFSHWTIQNDTIWPGPTDSLVTLTTDTTDHIIAHFIPPVQHSVMLDTEPRNSARILFDGVVYDALPTVVQVPQGVTKPIKVLPAQYFDFMHWDIKNNPPSPPDTTLQELSITFHSPDTVVAHLDPQEYAYWVPNSFTPNNDGINDTWQPWGNVIDLERFDLSIFDRWGQLVFRSQDPNAPWDGTDGSGTVRDGVYVYRAHVTEGITKERHEIYGHVTVIR